LFAFLWLSTLLLYWRSRGRSAARDVASRAGETATAGESQVLGNLRRACERGDASAARRNLLVWLRQFGPAADGSLLDFAAQCGDAALREGIYALDGEGFRRSSDRESAAGWEGGKFWNRFESWRRSWRAGAGERKPPLTDLYAPSNRAP
jgi:hypothetical protein